MVCHIKSILAQLNPDRPTMGDLAEAVGVRRNTISDLANNQSLPGLQTAYDIMDTLNQWAADRGIEKRWLIEEIWTR